MNFYLAGMLAETTYSVQHDIDTGGVVTQGPLLQFVSGSIPSHLQFPTTVLAGAPSGQTSFFEKVVLHDYMSGFPVATDLPGRVLWYYEPAARLLQTNRYFVRPLGGGFLIHMNDPTIPDLLLHKGQVIREIDLAGNTLRETNVTRVSEQLLQLGWSQGLTSFHHDAIRLPNGHTLTIASMEKMFPPGTQGSATSIDILGDAVIDLDENFQVVWAWSSYDQLDVNRGEQPLGCPPFVLAPTANDWLHSNSLNYVPSTGDFLISMRHQDWVLRIDYDNGTGTGAVVWRLGKDGDFTIDSSDAYPWFSHQHDAGFELDGTALLSIYDNGNTRVAQTRGSSRGQVYAIDETAMTARLLLNADLGVYAPAVGNGHRLANGNYHFGSGLLPSGSGIISHATEVLATGVRNYILRSDSRTYRSYRLPDLYTAPNK
jgi:hypothetical protein